MSRWIVSEFVSNTEAGNNTGVCCVHIEYSLEKGSLKNELILLSLWKNLCFVI